MEEDSVPGVFHYGEACIEIKFRKNNMVTVHASTTKEHEYPLRDYVISLPFSDLITWLGMRLPAQGTGSCIPIKVKGDLFMNVRTNVPPYINFGGCIILRLNDEAEDLVQYLNSEYIKRFEKLQHKTLKHK